MKVKICGLKEAEHARIAIKAGADFLGCVFFEPSPRHVDYDQARRVFEEVAGTQVKRVGLFVDPNDHLISEVLTEVGLDIIQLHGHETIKRVKEIRSLYGLPVMKAIPIANESDVQNAYFYDGVADYLLFDAKPPSGANRPGGNALAFDWSLLRDTHWQSPWLLAGGLNTENVEMALSLLHPHGVDVSSGVEASKGLKNPELIQTFIKSVKENSNPV